MATHIYRRGNVFKRSGVAIQAGSSYTVTAYQPGAQVEKDAGGGTIDVRVGHCFTAGDKFIVGTTATAMRVVTSVTATTVVYNPATSGAVTVAKGDLLVNLGPDTGSASQPNWDGSTKKIYTDYDAVDAISESRVSTNADGEYEYWYSGGDVWDVCRSSSTVVEQIEIVGTVGEPGVRYANAWATGGSGTAAAPWTGFRNVLASNCVIKFPAGYYSVGATALDVSSSYSNIVLEGDGDATVFLSDDGVNAIGHATNGVEASNVTFRNFLIDGQSDEKTVNGKGVYIGDATNILVDGVSFIDIPGSAINCTAGTACTNLRINRCRIAKVSGTNYSCENLTTDDPAASGGDGFGFITQKAPNAVISDCRVEDTEFSGIYIATGSDDTIIKGNYVHACENNIRFYANRVVVEDNYISAARYDGIRVGDGSDYCTISRNTIVNCTTNSRCSIRTDTAGSNAGGLVINNFSYNSGRFLELDNTAASTTGSVDWRIESNYIDTTAASAIALIPKCTRVAVANNTIRNSSGSGIATTDTPATTNSAWIYGNTYYNNTSGNETLSTDTTLWSFSGGSPFITGPIRAIASDSNPVFSMERAAGPAVLQFSRSGLPAAWRVYIDSNGHLTFDDYENTKPYSLCLKDVNGYVGILENNPTYILTVGGLSNTQRLGIHAQTTTLTCSSGTIVHSAQNFIPAGVLLVGVTARVTTAITGSPGPATIKIGTYTNDVSPVAIDITAFGTGISPLVDTTTDLSNTTQTSATFYATGCRVSITSGDGATFGGGVVRITCHYIILAAPAS